MSYKNYSESENFGNDDFEIIAGGTITSVPEFYAASCHCGIKRSRKDDLCIIYTPLDTCCSGVFTTNKFLAAPVIVCKEQLKNSRNIKAIVVNSGIANACTGATGYNNAIKTIYLASKYLNIDKDEVLVSSTGVIGKQLPMDKIERGVKICSKNLSRSGGHNAARAILTTDKYEKEVAVRIKVDGNEDIIIGGIAKGSGMIAPNMATMLSFISTNVNIPDHLLDSLLLRGVDESFNCITIDGCQSTNDMVMIQTNSSSKIEIKSKNDKYFNKFKNALFFVLKDLSRKIVKDGEGATKLIEINVINARSKADARKLSMGVANSMLFKTAMFGEDLNWGRINAALGSADCYFEPNKVDIYIGEILIVKGGEGVKFNKKLADKLLKKKDITFTINLNAGKEKSKVLTTDLSYDYVKINSLYHT